jgi:tripartite ATP-independent transporter DctP family solute receptor
LGARKFAELVKTKSAGRIQISVYSNAQLGSDLQMQSALRGGTQEFTVPSTATLVGLVKDFGLLGTPFAFSSEAQADAVLDGPFGRKLLATLPEKGLVGLAFWENGFRNMTNSKRPVQRVEDVSGLKVRTMQNTLYIDMFNGLGANAVPLAANEVYTALESNAIDAQENPYTVIHAQRFYDVQKYLSTTRHTYDVLVLLVSKKFWDSVTDGDRAIMQAAAAEATTAQRAISRSLNNELKANLMQRGMAINEVPETERQRMRQQMGPIVEKHMAGISPAMRQDFAAALAAIPRP